MTHKKIICDIKLSFCWFYAISQPLALLFSVSPKCSQYVQHIFLSSWSFEMRAETACDKHKKIFYCVQVQCNGECVYVVGRFVMQLIIMNWFFKHIYRKTISCHCNFSSVFTFYRHFFLGRKLCNIRHGFHGW